jgi:hypothetical protein
MKSQEAFNCFKPGADDYSPNFVISEKLYGRDEES